MKRLFGLFVAFLMVWVTNAGNAENWNFYLAYHNALACQSVGDEIYANFDGNLMTYHPEDGEVRFLSKLDGLNGRNIRLMGYSDTEKCLVLVYDNCQIDLLYPESGFIMSLPQVKNSGVDGVSAHRLFVNGNYAVLAMNNGVVLLNLKKQELTGYYVLDMDIRAAAFYKDVIFAAVDGDLYVCSVTDNPLDKHEWKKQQKSAFCDFFMNGSSLYGVTDKNVPEGLTAGLWLANEDGTSFKCLSDRVFPHFSARNGELVVTDNKQMLVFNSKNPGVAEKKVEVKTKWTGFCKTSDGKLWASEGYEGIRPYALQTDNLLKPVGDFLGNYGPRRDLCYYMRYVGNRLLIAGGRLDPYDRQHYPGTLMEYTDGKWITFQEDSISDQTGVPYRDITSVAVDPKDPNHIIASAGGTGLYEFENYKYVRHISNNNSPLQSAAGNSGRYVRMDGLNYDAHGNLWMVNTVAEDTILRARRPDGTWAALYIESIKNAPTCEKTLIDRKGRLWVASRRTVDNPRHDAGLLCLDYNGTLDNLKDDVSTYRSTFVNQDGKAYLLGGVYCMAEDKDGAIWVGTKVGLFVVANPDDWHKSDFNVIQIKVPRNDGTNLADYLLSDIPVSAIAVDGAGRKWIGTVSNGIYLVSADGKEVLEHFDEKNSPLLSNYIYSIAPNVETGEVMIGTDKGLCSYQSGATIPEESLNKDAVKVYPNPVRPDYHGIVKVTGLTDNAEVKIMTTGGEVVAVGTSTGGTFLWDARGGDGSRVSPGVYYLMIATVDGKKGIATKIVVI